MIFEPTAIAGAWLIRPQRSADDRGHFARLWCQEEFALHGIAMSMVQANTSFNHHRGTLRGLHFSAAPAREGKLVRCARGVVHDVILDLRVGSATYLRHVAIELRSDEATALYVPPGLAHGFQTLEDQCEMHYLMTEAYRPELARGVRYDDPAFDINWPLPVALIHERDRGYPDFDARALGLSDEAGTAA